MPQFTKYTSIESFAHVLKGQTFYDTPARVVYGAKPKLHGTNAAVGCDPDGIIYAQSRSRIITPVEDNLGFAQWVADNVGAWAEAFNLGPAGNVLVHGEWAGKGIQKGDAVCQLNQRYFFPFAIQIDDDIVVRPDIIEEICPDLDDLVVLPWLTQWDLAEWNLGDESETMLLGGKIGKLVKSMEEVDPFINHIFDVQGPGEGVVVTPLHDLGGTPDDYSMPREWYARLTFKSKTEAHAVKKNQGSKTKIEVPQSVIDFGEMFVTDARCEQALAEIGGEADLKRTGDFLKWIGQDIKKESVEELADMGLEFRDVGKQISIVARKWWLKKCEEI